MHISNQRGCSPFFTLIIFTSEKSLKELAVAFAFLAVEMQSKPFSFLAEDLHVNGILKDFILHNFSIYQDGLQKLISEATNYRSILLKSICNQYWILFFFFLKLFVCGW